MASEPRGIQLVLTEFKDSGSEGNEVRHSYTYI